MGESEDLDLTLALAGDAIITRRISTSNDPGVTQLAEIVSAAVTGFVNLEMLLHNYEGYPAANSGGTYMRAPPWVADELTWMGFELFNAATNHAGDYSHGGMAATMRELDARDVAHAGLGQNLAEAREPAYRETAGGRVGLVAACSWFPPGIEAGRQRPDLQGRPGIAPLNVNATYIVPEEALNRIQDLSEQLGLEDAKSFRKDRGFQVPNETDEAFPLLHVGGDGPLRFQAGDEYAIRQDVDSDDLIALRRQIRAADRQADWVVVSLHVHQGDGGLYNDDSVPSFLEQVAHECVDVGADVVVGHGPHVLRGIEVYDDAPIFYSLGNLFMQNETITRQPAELYEEYELDPTEALPAELFDERGYDGEGMRCGFLADQSYWLGVLPVCHFVAGELASVNLYPLDLGFQDPRPRRGSPALASDEVAENITTRITELSAPYGTEISFDGECATIDL